MRVRRQPSSRARTLPDVRRLGLALRTAVSGRTVDAGRSFLMSDLPQPFLARRRSHNGRVVIELSGECDMATLDELNEILREAVAAQPRELVIDLAQATFVDSLTLGALTSAARQVRARGGSFRLARVFAPEIKLALAITGLDGYLSIG
jgi:anti-sigma B factor antagonist